MAGSIPAEYRRSTAYVRLQLAVIRNVFWLVHSRGPVVVQSLASAVAIVLFAWDQYVFIGPAYSGGI